MTQRHEHETVNDQADTARRQRLGEAIRKAGANVDDAKLRGVVDSVADPIHRLREFLDTQRVSRRERRDVAEEATRLVHGELYGDAAK